MSQFNVIIIGAGAAGLMCAIEAGKKGKNVLIVDHAKIVGTKIRISGGGRCNFTNIHINPTNYLSDNPNFCISALKRFTPKDFINIVEKYNIKYYEKTLGQQFCNESSKEIVNMLLSECEKANVKIQLETSIEEIKKIENIFKIKTKDCIFKTEKIVIATGGLSIPDLRATNFGYQIAKQFGINVIPTSPALVPFIFEKSLLNHTINLAGISFDAVVFCKNKQFRESLLFTHKGLSGPAILQISSYWKNGDKITINFLPDLNVFEYIQNERTNKPRQEIQTILIKILPKKFVDYVLCNIQYSGFIADFSNKKIKEISEFINNWTIIPNGTEGFNKAEVTLGGVDTTEISSKTFESNKISGLYFIGEVLDVTGQLGGYNLQWAWSSGYVTGIMI